MSSLATVNISDLTDVRYGSTLVKRIMHGSNRLWPQYPYILKVGNDFYTVTGISNNEYQKTIIPDTVITCPLVYIQDMSFNTGIEVVPKYQFEYGICGFTGPILYDERMTRSNNGCANISNGNYSNRLYWKYMGSSSVGTNTQLQYITDTTVVRKDQTTTAYIYNFALEEYPNYTNRYYKRIYRTDFTNNGSKSQLTSTTVYDYAASSQQSYMAGRYWHIGDTNNASGSYDAKFWCNFYYAKFFDYDGSLIGFYHFKLDNGQLKMYDEVTKTFLTSSSGNDAQLTQVSNNSINVDNGAPKDYYTIDGTITKNGVIYDRLVNSLDNTKIIKGIIISEQEQQDPDTPVTLANPEVEWLLPDYDLQMTCSTPGASIYWSVSGESPEDATYTEPVLYTEPVNWSVLYDLDEQYSQASEGFVKVQSYLNGQWSEVVEFDFWAS